MLINDTVYVEMPPFIIPGIYGKDECTVDTVFTLTTFVNEVHRSLVLKYIWDLGDGSFLTSRPDSPEISYVYKKPGVYNVKLCPKIIKHQGCPICFEREVEVDWPLSIEKSNDILPSIYNLNKKVIVESSVSFDITVSNLNGAIVAKQKILPGTTSIELHTTGIFIIKCIIGSEIYSKKISVN
ncbi:MAG: PKD domain-containing protein [Bacteroidia bacterium]